MARLTSILPGIFAFLIAVTSVSAQLTQDQIQKIVNDIDELYRSQSSRGEMEMDVVTPHWERTLVMNVWTEGMDKTFIRITDPAKEKGVGTLRIEDEMWNYLPKTNKVIKIPPSMMMSSWMGSDFNNDDLVNEFSLLDDYTYEPAQPDNPDSSLIYIKCTPRPDLPIVWGSIVIAAERDSHIPRWEKYYDEKGKLARVLSYSDVTDFDGRRIPAVMEMVPQDEEGHRTVIRYKKLEFNVGLQEEVFTLRNLRTPSSD